jgi:hypothetical protein
MRLPRRLVVIESPYTGDVLRNVAYAERCLRDSVFRGEAPLASHLLYPGALSEETERLLGIECGLAWLPHAEAHVFYTDRGWSFGMCAALRATTRLVELRALDGAVVQPPAVSGARRLAAVSCAP